LNQGSFLNHLNSVLKKKNHVCLWNCCGKHCNKKHVQENTLLNKMNIVIHPSVHNRYQDTSNGTTIW